MALRRNKWAGRYPATGTDEWYDLWLSTSWMISRGGTYWITIREGWNVAVMRDRNQPELWTYRLKDPGGQETWGSYNKRNTKEAAMRAALEDLVKRFSG